MQKARLAVHHRSACSANLIPGDGTKNGFPAPNKEPATNQKRLFDRKSPIQVTCEPDFLDQIRKFVKCSGAIVPVELLPDLVPRINVDSGDFAGLSAVLDFLQSPAARPIASFGPPARNRSDQTTLPRLLRREAAVG
jgi:hypothetical protein